jgi:membrane protein DedA with SNARE-associated domain
LFPPVAANLLAGMTKISWSSFLFFDLTGSAAYTISYILLGYWFGKSWKLFVAWLGPTASYLVLGGIALVVVSVIFRHRLSKFLVRLFSSSRDRR